MSEITSSQSQGTSGDARSTLWSRFTSANGRDEYCRSWLALQCSLIADAAQAVVVLREADGTSFTPVAKWPEDAQEVERLAELAERVLAERTGLLVELEGAPGGGASDPHCGMGYPILVDEVLHGVAVVEVVARSPQFCWLCFCHCFCCNMRASVRIEKQRFTRRDSNSRPSGY